MKDLDVIMNSSVSFGVQMNPVVKVMGYHWRNNGFVMKCLDEQTIKMFLHNYCMSSGSWLTATAYFMVYQNIS